MREWFKPSLSLLLIAIGVTLGLVLVNAMTVDVIAARNEADAAAKRREVLPEATRFEPLDEAQADWRALDPDKLIQAVYIGYDDAGQTVGYVYDVETPGYGGDIDSIVAVRRDNLTLGGLRIARHQETAGLGALAAEPAFYGQFEGRGGPGVRLEVIRAGGREPAAAEVESLTSATITSRALARAANACLALSEKLNEGGLVP